MSGHLKTAFTPQDDNSPFTQWTGGRFTEHRHEARGKAQYTIQSECTYHTECTYHHSCSTWTVIKGTIQIFSQHARMGWFALFSSFLFFQNTPPHIYFKKIKIQHNVQNLHAQEKSHRACTKIKTQVVFRWWLNFFFAVFLFLFVCFLFWGGGMVSLCNPSWPGTL